MDILIPKSSVLWTGERAVVYVKVPERDQPSFTYREIVLGPESGNFYVVADGLEEGEEIAVNGVFKIDAAAQLEGKQSMMNPEGGMLNMEHNHGSTGSAGNVMEAGSGPMNTENASAEIDPEFKNQLQNAYKAYIDMKNAYVDSDPGQIKKEAEKLNTKLMSVDMELLKGDSHMKWMNLLDIMQKAISTIDHAGDLPQQRIAFAQFNDAFYNTLEFFGLQSGKVYYQYCPMANGDKGAYWLSEIKEIRNPYFGDEMLSCGETRETLDFE